MRTRSRNQRGVTLVETMIALVVLATGVAAVFGMVTHVTNANRSLTFQANSLDAFSRVAAQIQDAQCDVDSNGVPLPLGGIDPGLAGPQGVWIQAPIALSAISFVGVTDGVALPRTQPQMRIEYQLSADPTVAPPSAPAFDINVRVREITNDPVRDALGFAPAVTDGGYWIRVYPVKKVCVTRVDDLARGYQ